MPLFSNRFRIGENLRVIWPDLTMTTGALDTAETPSLLLDRFNEKPAFNILGWW